MAGFRASGGWRLSGDELRALAVLIPLAALGGYLAAHRLAAPTETSATSGFRLSGPVTHVRDGDTIEVTGVPIRIANLDCAEMNTSAGVQAKVVMRQLVVLGEASCTLEGRRSYDREVGVCTIPGVGDLGEAMISAGACTRWRW